MIRRLLPLLLVPAALVGCSGDDEPTTAPTSSSAARPSVSPLGEACDYLPDAEVSDALGDTVEGVATGREICSWGELDLSVVEATQAEFDEERNINSADSPAPPLGLGDDSYLIVGEPGGFGSAGVLVGGRKVVLALPGGVPQDVQKQILTQFAQRVAAQL